MNLLVNALLSRRHHHRRHRRPRRHRPPRRHRRPRRRRHHHPANHQADSDAGAAEEIDLSKNHLNASMRVFSRKNHRKI